MKKKEMHHSKAEAFKIMREKAESFQMAQNDVYFIVMFS